MTATISIAKSFAAKVLTLPVSALSSVIVSRTIIDRMGVSGYGTLSIIIALPALIPIADFGMGAAITNAVAKDAQSPHTAALVRTAATRLAAIGLISSVAAVLLTISENWHNLLGFPPSAQLEIACGASMVLYFSTLPLTLGYRILLGIGRNHFISLYSALASTSTVAIVLLADHSDAPVWVFASAPAMGLLVWTPIATLHALSRSRVNIGRPVSRQVYTVARTELWRSARPMIVILLALPIAFQTDRLILNHVAGAVEVAAYSAVMILYSPLYAIAQTTGQALWPHFARERSSPRSSPIDLYLFTRNFALAGLVAGAGLTAFGPLVVDTAINSRIDVSHTLCAAFGSLILAHATFLPVGMLLTSPEGLRTQAKASIAMVAANLPLSILLTASLGASGPVVASSITIFGCMLVPCHVAVRRSNG